MLDPDEVEKSEKSAKGSNLKKEKIYRVVNGEYVLVEKSKKEGK